MHQGVVDRQQLELLLLQTSGLFQLERLQTVQRTFQGIKKGIGPKRPQSIYYDLHLLIHAGSSAYDFRSNGRAAAAKQATKKTAALFTKGIRGNGGGHPVLLRYHTGGGLETVALRSPAGRWRKNLTQGG